MANAQNIDVNNAEGREQDVYSPRSEADIEQVIERMEEVESEEVENAVRQINEIADGDLREVVRNHFEAPIRSLNNPQENTVEIQERYKPGDDTILSNRKAVEAFNKILHDQEPPKKEAQVVGEEYFVNQNLPGFGDVGNIKWWTLIDEGSYREETRNGGLEHLQLDNEGEIYGFHIERDGKPIKSEEIERLERNLSIRQNNQSNSANNIPEMVLNYKNITEVLDEEDLDREEFESHYEKAQQLGLVTEGANLTLKGWLSAADIHARDLRSFENLSNNQDTLFLQRELINSDLISDGETESVEMEISYSLNHPEIDQPPFEQWLQRDIRGACYGRDNGELILDDTLSEAMDKLESYGSVPDRDDDINIDTDIIEAIKQESPYEDPIEDGEVHLDKVNKLIINGNSIESVDSEGLDELDDYIVGKAVDQNDETNITSLNITKDDEIYEVEVEQENQEIVIYPEHNPFGNSEYRIEMEEFHKEENDMPNLDGRPDYITMIGDEEISGEEVYVTAGRADLGNLESEIEVEASIETTGRVGYSPGPEVRKIANALDPMNFDKTPYDRVELETDFDYEEERQQLTA